MKTLEQIINSHKEIETLTRDNKYLGVLNYIYEHKPKLIIEYGGGKSTYCLKLLLDDLDYGGKVVGFEDNKIWYDDHVRKGFNEDNIIKLVDTEYDEYFTERLTWRGRRYLHSYEEYKDVDLVILDGPDFRDDPYDPHTTFNLMDMVELFERDIPFFIDGRTGTTGFYCNELKYPGYIQDIKNRKE